MKLIANVAVIDRITGFTAVVTGNPGALPGQVEIAYRSGLTAWRVPAELSPAPARAPGSYGNGRLPLDANN